MSALGLRSQELTTGAQDTIQAPAVVVSLERIRAVQQSLDLMVCEFAAADLRSRFGEDAHITTTLETLKDSLQRAKVCHSICLAFFPFMHALFLTHVQASVDVIYASLNAKYEALMRELVPNGSANPLLRAWKPEDWASMREGCADWPQVVDALHAAAHTVMLWVFGMLWVLVCCGCWYVGCWYVVGVGMLWV